MVCVCVYMPVCGQSCACVCTCLCAGNHVNPWVREKGERVVPVFPGVDPPPPPNVRCSLACAASCPGISRWRACHSVILTAVGHKGDANGYTYIRSYHACVRVYKEGREIDREKD